MSYGKFHELHRGHILFIDYQYNKLRDSLQDLADDVEIVRYKLQSKEARNRRIYRAVLDGWLYADIAAEHGISKVRVGQIVNDIKRAIVRHECKGAMYDKTAM